MENIEDKNIEYKSEIPKKSKELKAEIVSFLNSEGGSILLGVDDYGNILEDKVKCYKEWEETLSNWINNAFEPNVINLINIHPNKKPFIIEIKSGPNKPYFYKDGEGFNAKGVYVRVGSSKRVASLDEIQRFMYKSKAYRYEEVESLNQDLTFTYAMNVFKEKGVKFDLIGLGLYTHDKKFNNAALLLSDQNPTVTKFAVFQGLDVTTFLDKKEFKGSIMKQLDDVLYVSNLSNRKKVVITGKPQRDEFLDYPKKALREAIVNCYCHRDWTLSGYIKLEFYDDRVQIFSPGSLPDGLTLENIKEGMSAKRNPIIVNALDKADYIENYSSGVRRIFKDYIGFHKQPYFYISNNGVIVTLYSMNYYDKLEEPIENDVQNDIQSDVQKQNDVQNVTQNDVQRQNDVQNDTQSDVQNDVQNMMQIIKPKERKEKIIKMIQFNNDITIDEMSKALRVSRPTIERDLSYLRKKGEVKYVGSAKKGKWVVAK